MGERMPDGKQEDQARELLAGRVLRLEERLERLESAKVAGGTAAHPAWPFTLGLAAIVFGYLGMGVPRHPYPYLFAMLLMLLAYHRRFLRLSNIPWRWPLMVMNFLNLVLYLMIVLGGGVRRPLAWFKLPAVVKSPPPESGTWYHSLVPDYSFQWHDIPALSAWSVDLTKIQAFLLIATLAGALFRFQGFTSITALALLIVSIPVYLAFTWDWVVLFLITASVSLYLQSRASIMPFEER